MGYFSAAFVFGRTPDWEKIDALAPAVSLLGFRHDSGLHLLACRSNVESKLDWPFAEFVTQPILLPDTPTPYAELASALADSSGAVSAEYYGQVIGRSALELGNALHSALGIDTFFFAADDEGLNMAFLFRGGGLQQFLQAGTEGTVELRGDRAVVTPRMREDEEEFSNAPTLAEDLEGRKLIEVKELQLIDPEADDSLMYSSSIALWPKGWPDPTDSLGLGTWNLMPGFPQGFSSVYGRLGT